MHYRGHHCRELFASLLGSALVAFIVSVPKSLVSPETDKRSKPLSLVTADDAERVSWAPRTKKESIRMWNDGHCGENKSGQAN